VKENKTYQKFVNFCKDTKAETELSVETNNNTKAELEAKMELLKVKQEELATVASKLDEDISDSKAKLHSMGSDRAIDRAAHTKNVVELQSGLTSVEKAIESVKVAPSSFLQQDAKDVARRTLQQALKIAKASGFPSAADDFQSSSILETLDSLQKDFKDALNEAELNEAKAHSNHMETTLVLQQTLQRLEQELSENTAAQGLKKEDFHATSQEFASVEADLSDDAKYLKETTTMCEEKAATFAQREAAHAEEVEALSTASSILQDSLGKESSQVSFGLTSALTSPLVVAEAEAEAAEAAGSLLQGHSAVLPGKQDTSPLLPALKVAHLHAQLADASSRHAADDDKRQAIEELLRTKAEEIKSPALLFVANSASKDPLEKVKTMISGLITDLHQQMAESQTHQAYCETTISRAEDKRSHAASAIEGLNLQVSQQQARRDQMSQAIASLQNEIAELKTAKANATELRQEEAAEANASAVEARQARDAVANAKKVIEDFYSQADDKKPKTASAMIQGRATPDAGFGTGETYEGEQGGATGVLGMLDVAESNFAKAAKEIEANEKKAAAEHLAFLQDTEVSTAAKEEAMETKQKFKLETLEQLSKDEEKLGMESRSLQGSVSELAELDKVCGVGSTAEERQQKRQEQIEALKEAIKYFDDIS